MVEMNIKKCLRSWTLTPRLSTPISLQPRPVRPIFRDGERYCLQRQRAGNQLVVINNIIDINELEAQLRAVRKTTLIRRGGYVYPETLNFVVDIFKVPSVLVGLIALIGLVAQKKSLF